MENISYIGLSQKMALRSMMDVNANNIANMTTPGYKAQKVLFVEYLNKAQGAGPGDAIRQVQDYATYRDLSQGGLQMTHNDLDVALEGEGFFAVQGADGVARYTRNGSFMLDGTRQIVNKMGVPVMGVNNTPLVVPPEARHITITPDGSVTTDQGDVGQLKVATFDNLQMLKPMGDGLYDAGGMIEQPVVTPRVVQGAVEGSNVNPILEMNRMVEVLRMYQSTYRMLQNDHERIRGAIQKLTRV